MYSCCYFPALIMSILYAARNHSHTIAFRPPTIITITGVDELIIAAVFGEPKKYSASIANRKTTCTARAVRATCRRTRSLSDSQGRNTLGGFMTFYPHFSEPTTSARHVPTHPVARRAPYHSTVALARYSAPPCPLRSAAIH